MQTINILKNKIKKQYSETRKCLLFSKRDGNYEKAIRCLGGLTELEILIRFIEENNL